MTARPDASVPSRNGPHPRASRHSLRRQMAGLGITLALLTAACGTTNETAFDSNPPAAADSGGGSTATTAPPADPACNESDPTRSLAPEGPLPPPEQLPAGSYMAEIRQRGVLRAGVGADTLLFGFLNPRSGDIEGFDVEMARLVAIAIFGTDVGHLELVPIQSSQRIPFLQTPVDEGGVDLVVKTMTINCERWGSINFSAVYYNSGQQLLVQAESGITSINDLTTDDAICAVSGTTSLDRLVAEGIAVYEAGDWTDCLVEFEQGRVAGVSTDDTILAGLAAQDPYAQIVGDKFSEEPYGIGLPKDHPEFTQFVNAVLEQAKADGGAWQAQFDTWLTPTLPSQPAPLSTYR